MNKKQLALQFIIHHSSFIISKAEAVRLERTGARTPGGLAGRCTTVYASPPKSLTEGVGVEPTGAFAPTVFGTARRARAQPSTGGGGARV